MGDYFDIEFHRGGRDARPENTLYSYQYALEHGATTIECDMQMTKDNQIVMSHNPCLNSDITVDKEGRRIENYKYLIRDLTLEELKTYNVGRMDETSDYYKMHGRTQVQVDATIPTLRELFELVKKSQNKTIKMSIEAKYYPDPIFGPVYQKNPDIDLWLKEFIKLVDEFGFKKRVVLQCFDWGFLVRAKQLDKDIETIALYNEQKEWGLLGGMTLWLDREEPSPWLGGINIHDFDSNPIKAIHHLGIDNVSPYYKEITKEQIDEAHQYGMRVVPWTVNNIEDMKKMYEMGADGIITDKPWILKEFLLSRGEKIIENKVLELPYHISLDHKDAEDIDIDGGKDAKQ